MVGDAGRRRDVILAEKTRSGPIVAAKVPGEVGLGASGGCKGRRDGVVREGKVLNWKNTPVHILVIRFLLFFFFTFWRSHAV